MKIKNAISMLLVLAMLVSFACVGMTAFAAEEEIPETEQQIVTDGAAEMTDDGRYGEGITWSLSADGKTLTLDGAGTFSSFSDYEGNGIETVNIGKNIDADYYSFFFMDSVKNIYVASGNPYVSSVGGVLFDASGKTLLYLPPARTGSYTLPSGVTAIDKHAFYGSKCTSVTIPVSVTAVISNSDFDEWLMDSNLSDIYYLGTGLQWAAVTKPINKPYNLNYRYTMHYTETVQSGFTGKFDEDNVRYYINGVMQTGWVTIGGHQYYFDPGTGYMARDYTVISGDIYYFDGYSGAMYTDQLIWDNKGAGVFYLSSDGKAVKNQWVRIDGKWYYFGQDCQAVHWGDSGLEIISGKTYYFISGVMQTGTFTIEGNQYTFGADGAMVTDPVRTGWVQDGGSWYYYSTSGVVQKTGWTKIGSTWYYLSKDTGVMAANEWVDGCYMTSSGAMATGWVQTASGDWMLFSSSGKQLTGWQKSGGVWYYLDPDSGIMVTDAWVGSYYMTSSGVMATGWVRTDDGWMLFSSAGKQLTGWQKSGSSWYYMDADTGVMQTGWLNDNGTWYYLAPSGRMGTGWQNIDGSWYLFASNGAMLTGWQRSGSAWYYMDPDTGAMYAAGVYTIGGLQSNFAASGAWLGYV